MQIQNKISKYFTTLIIIAIAANALGLCNDILDADGALYATLAKNIANTNDFVNLFGDGREWLDKPHFPFWITAISFKIFGVNAFAYKLPSFLFFLIACYYTYKISVKLFCVQTAQLATLIFASALHIVLCNFDVRAEIYLTGSIVAALYFLITSTNDNWFKNVVFASLFTACAIMTKGIFVFITIGSGFVLYWILNKTYQEFLSLKWYVYVALSLLFITPELYCLYTQFDAHPEKLVFGQHNVSGIKFFFWDSQFGRFFNTGPIQGEGDIFFFLHTTLWAFLPWSVFIILAIYKNIKSKKIVLSHKATILYCGALCSFIMFSISKFQLPHYIVIIFPMLSIYVARYFLCNSSVSAISINKKIVHFAFLILCIVIVLVTLLYQFKSGYASIVLVAIFISVSTFCFKEKTLYALAAKGLCFSILFSIFFNLIFYPAIMQYQAAMIAGEWQKRNLPNTNISMYHVNENLFELYGNSNRYRNKTLNEILHTEKNAVILTNNHNLKGINTDSFYTKPIQYFPSYGVTGLTYEFINKSTRVSVLDSLVLVRIGKKYK